MSREYSVASKASARVTPLRGPAVQARLTVSQPDDAYELEAERVADEVMRMPGPVQGHEAPVASRAAPALQRLCSECEDEASTQPLQRKGSGSGVEVSEEQGEAITRLRSTGGQPLPQQARGYFEPRFGWDFSNVRIHSDHEAADVARQVQAQAFTVGNDVMFAAGQYRPDTDQGRRLLAHELTHVVQQGAGGPSRVQRTLGDGHDLTSPRFTNILDLEAAYDDETLIKHGSSGRGVQAVQQALYDLGFTLRNFGADGEFGNETERAVRAFQRANPPLAVDGKVGPETMAALDARFGAVKLPAAAVRNATWTPDCVREILCPWSPHTISVLSSRITLKSFDSISWDDEEWDGSAWVPAPFPGGGYNTGTEIGILNGSCEEVAEILYHEVLHAEQPRTHRTTLARESYAYRIGEEFSIAMGLGGRPALRTTDAQGREFADPAKVGAFVASEYPSVASSGGGGEEIIGKAATLGHVRVQRANGSVYTRPAAIGEKVPGPENLVNEVTHPTSSWACP